MVVDKDLCEAYRKGCQETILAKFGSIADRVESHSLAIVAHSVALATLSTNIELLKVNEVAHLKDELNLVKRMRREPLGNKEWALIVSAFIAAAASVAVALVGR